MPLTPQRHVGALNHVVSQQRVSLILSLIYLSVHPSHGDDGKQKEREDIT